MNRSYLYAPGSRPDLMAKALAAGADAVVFDLEDAVHPSAKLDARAAVAAEVRARVGSAACEVHVRVGRVSGGFDLDDVRAVAAAGLTAVRLPKCADPDEVARVGSLLDELGPAAVRLYVTIESARGVLNAGALATAHRRVERLCLGATDLLADIGARGQPHGAALDTARSLLVLHSRAAGIGPPVDSVHTALADPDGLRESASRARDFGFFGKSVIHPRQLPVVHEVFTPSPEDRDRAERIVTAFDRAQRDGVSAVSMDGEFVDPAVVARARALLDLPR